MKISITIDGGITFDVSGDDDFQVGQAIRAIVREVTRSKLPLPKLSTPVKRKPRVVGSLDSNPLGLNAIQYQTWKYLSDNDTESGVHLSAVARAMSISDGAAGCRCSTLVKLGWAKRTREGYYRAVDNIVGLMSRGHDSAQREASMPTPRDVAERNQSVTQ